MSNSPEMASKIK